MDFKRKLAASWAKNNSLLSVGLDPNLDMLPKHLTSSKTPFFDFNRAIIDATADLVCAFKPNSAFYEARGADGVIELKQTCDYIREKFPDLPIILDFKRGDIGNTNSQYIKFAFDYLQVDAVTVQPYQGRQAIQPFLDLKDKGIMVLCRTSNPGSEEFQDMLVDDHKLYVNVAEHVRDEWNANENCQLVVGATYPAEVAEIRALVGNEMVLLVPGIGAQGGELESTIKGGVTKDGNGLVINSSRAIIYASSKGDFAKAARLQASDSRDEINNYRK
ncbi:MAG TPA: orotidine-5'-phosphate decarboxylase [Candidatus Saccharimonadales bacterium]|nr:orotidine-5'-phosphate decarboxylase [Candidatus Saccharimonadales bacterium]